MNHLIPRIVQNGDLSEDVLDLFARSLSPIANLHDPSYLRHRRVGPKAGKHGPPDKRPDARILRQCERQHRLNARKTLNELAERLPIDGIVLKSDHRRIGFCHG